MNNILQKIKNLVFVKDNQEFAEVEMEDGRVVMISTESMEIGTKVSVIAEDGSEEMLEKGAYKLSDGTEFVIDEMGMVTEMPGMEVSPEVIAEEEEMEEVEEIVSDEVVEVITDIVSDLTPDEVTPEDSAVIADVIKEYITSELVKAEESMNSKFEAFKDLLIGLAESQEKMTTDFTAYKKEPSGKSISQTEFNSMKDADSLSERIERIKAIRESKN